MTETTTTPASSLLLRLLPGMASVPNQSPRDRHKVAIFQSICEVPGATRKDLIERMGIRPGTVSDITAELIADGLVHESSPVAQGERGRPEVPLNPVWSKWVAISVCCSSMELCAELMNASDEPLFRKTKHVPFSADNSEVESLLLSLILELKEQVADGSELLGVTLSIAGLVDSEKLDWIFSARWPRIRHLVLDRLQTTLGVPVVLRRQLDLQLEYAMLSNPVLREGNTLLFHWGYGIGGAFASNGAVVQSSTGVFCQIGHVSVFPRSTRPCICGRIGCLEADAALWALTPDIERSYGPVPQNELDLLDFLATHPVSDQPYFQHALVAVGHALSHLLAILVPDRVLVYGPFVANSVVFEQMLRDVRRLSPPFVADNTTIEVVGKESLSDAVAGTAALFRKAYQSKLVRS